MTTIGLIVEGHGEVLALPSLVARVAQEVYQRFDVRPQHAPIRVKRGRFKASFGDYESALELLGASHDRILVVLDSDNEDPEQLANELELRAARCISHRKVLVAPAVREFEAWFLASLSSMAGRETVLSDAHFDEDPERFKGAKAKFASFLSNGVYSESVDQKRYAAMIDIRLAATRSSSFANFVEKLGELLNHES